MNEHIFIIGGCRSGKSKHALQMAEKMPGKKKIFIATCEPEDDEMKQRVAQHQRDRRRSWSTVEEPLHLPQAILENSRGADVVVVDCLTLWVSNLLRANDDDLGFVPALHLSGEYRIGDRWLFEVVAAQA